MNILYKNYIFFPQSTQTTKKDKPIFINANALLIDSTHKSYILKELFQFL